MVSLNVKSEIKEKRGFFDFDFLFNTNSDKQSKIDKA